MDCSIIVPLSGDPVRALAMLEALAAVPDDVQHEVVLVDDGSPDLGPLLARVDGDARVIRLPVSVGAAAAVRAGVQVATGAVLVVLGEGTLLDPAALAVLHRALAADDGLAGAAAAALHPTAASVLAWRADVGLDVPEAPADRLIAALCCSLVAHGEVACVPGADAGHVRDVPVARSRLAPGSPVQLSIAIPTLDAAGDRLRACVRALQAHTSVAYELIVVDNGAPPQGFTDPVNAALRAARGRHLVVCNDDVLVQPGWWEPLRAALEHPRDPAAVVFPQTVGGAMRTDFAAWCFAFSRTTLDRFSVAPGEFFDRELRVWYQDTDLLARLRAAGTPPRLVRESTIRHGLSETVASPDPVLRAWVHAQVQRDRMAFERRHGAAVAGAAA